MPDMRSAVGIQSLVFRSLYRVLFDSCSASFASGFAPVLSGFRVGDLGV